MRKIRCTECGATIAIENDDGTITVMCNHRRRDGKRCKVVNVIARAQKTE